VSAGPRLELRARAELGDYPVDVAWSPEAASLAVAGGEGAVLLLARSATSPQVLGQHAGGALAVSWQSSGPRFASGGQDGSALLWDARTCASQPLLGSTQWLEHLAFSGSGKLLAAARGRELHLFDASGAARHVFDSHPGVITALAWRPKSSEVATVGNGGAHIHRLEPQPLMHEYAWRGACLSASWSPDGRVLAAGMQDGSVHLWYMASGTQSQIQGYGAKVTLTDWSANNRFLATASAEVVIVWDFAGKGAEGSRPLELRAHSERVVALAFRPQGTWLVSAAADWRVLVWRVGQGEQPQDAHMLSAPATVLRWSPDGRWLAVGDERGGLSLFEWTA
jgi:WD40 repeat protein